MNVLSFDEAALGARLALLDKRALIAFAAACSQRIFPSYVEYARVAPPDQSDLAAFEESLNHVWNASLFGEKEKKITDDLRKRCEAILPSEADAWEWGVPYAEDAAAVVLYCLRLLCSGDNREAFWVARRLYEATDNFVSTVCQVDFDDSQAESQLLEHPIIQNELRRQLRDLDDLAGAKEAGGDSHVAYSAIRKRSEYEAALLFAAP